MKLLALLFCLSSLSAFAETLTFHKFGLIAETSWQVMPTTSKETKMLVQFSDERGQPVEADAKFSVELYMPQMGHGSGPTALERILDANDDITPGLFRVKNMWFMMKGFWEVRLTLKKGAVTETLVQEVTL